jgi:hypothetical protein
MFLAFAFRQEATRNESMDVVLSREAPKTRNRARKSLQEEMQFRPAVQVRFPVKHINLPISY